MNIIEQANAIREAMDYAGSKLDEESALVCARLFRPYEVGHSYSINDYFIYGENSVGDPQLYKVVQNHVSQSDWGPDKTPALYSPLGLNDNGYAIWSKPTGSHDAYNAGDIVDYQGVLYQSIIDGNVWAPDEYPAGWAKYEN